MSKRRAAAFPMYAAQCSALIPLSRPHLVASAPALSKSMQISLESLSLENDAAVMSGVNPVSSRRLRSGCGAGVDLTIARSASRFASYTVVWKRERERLREIGVDGRVRMSGGIVTTAELRAAGP